MARKGPITRPRRTHPGGERRFGRGGLVGRSGGGLLAMHGVEDGAERAEVGVPRGLRPIETVGAEGLFAGRAPASLLGGWNLRPASDAADGRRRVRSLGEDRVLLG